MLDRMEVAELVWQLEEVTYGSWEEGPNGDSTWSKTLQLDVPEVGCVRACVRASAMFLPTCPFLLLLSERAEEWQLVASRVCKEVWCLC